MIRLHSLGWRMWQRLQLRMAYLSLLNVWFVLEVRKPCCCFDICRPSFFFISLNFVDEVVVCYDGGSTQGLIHLSVFVTSLAALTSISDFGNAGVKITRAALALAGVWANLSPLLAPSRVHSRRIPFMCCLARSMHRKSSAASYVFVQRNIAAESIERYLHDAFLFFLGASQPFTTI
jgi:hypothetical protein